MKVLRSVLKDTIILHTGDVLRHETVLSHLHQNSHEKLNCFLEKVSKEGKIYLRQGNIVNPQIKEVYEKKPNIKSTLKIFLKKYSSENVREAVEVFRQQIGYPRVDQLIISFPSNNSCNYMDRAVPLWHDVETLVESGVVFDLGAANIGLMDLITLCKQARSFPPSLFHAPLKQINTCACSSAEQSFKDTNETTIMSKVRLMAHDDHTPVYLTSISWKIVENLTNTKCSNDRWISRYIPYTYTYWFSAILYGTTPVESLYLVDIS